MASTPPPLTTTTKPSSSPSPAAAGAPSSPPLFNHKPKKQPPSWQATLDGLQPGAKFTDADFPAGHSSLYDPGYPAKEKDKDGKWQPSWGGLAITWARAGETPSLPSRVHDGEIGPGDINQGRLEDCYFLSALSVLAEGPRGTRRVERLLTTLEPNAAGVYGARFFKRGFPVEVVVDDAFPCVVAKAPPNAPATAAATGAQPAAVLRPVFSISKTGELWPLVLEKAYAKLHGSYQRIEAGAMSEALEDLTGAPTQLLKLSAQKLPIEEKEQTCEELWARMRDAQARGFVICAGTSRDAAKGLVPDHAYGVLGVQEHELAKDKWLRLVKMRNPWGNGEWKGDWSDASDQWTPDLREAFGCRTAEDDGIFFMAIDDFQKHIDRVAILLLNDGWRSTALALEPGQHVVRLTVPATTTAAGECGAVKTWVSLKSEDRRLMGPGYEYPKMSFKVARAPDAAADGAWHIVHYSGKIRARDIHSCVHIVPGATYYVSVARTPAIGSTPPPVTLSAYCSQACRLQVSEDPNVRRQLRHASARDGLRLMPEKARVFNTVKEQALADGGPLGL